MAGKYSEFRQIKRFILYKYPKKVCLFWGLVCKITQKNAVKNILQNKSYN